MFWRLRHRFQAKRFTWQIRGILDTPPIRIVDAPLTIISMTSEQDALMYLLAIKSFYREIGRGKIAAIIRGDTSTATRQLLERHIVGIEFVHIEDIETGTCQRGGTWERLCYIIDRSQSEYVIQLDSDTLTIGPDLTEVQHCIEQNRPFTMADGGAQLRPLRLTAEVARQDESNHVTIAAERVFDCYPGCDRLHYVRGSSGFSGFTPKAFICSQLEEFHRNMLELLGERWTEWGTEQCASNFAVANSPDAVVLPFPAYSSFGPESIARAQQTKFFHFIGTWRFHDGFFAEQGRKVIETLTAPDAQLPSHAAPHHSMRGK